MNAEKRSILSQEAEMQMRALHKISVWKNIAIAVSTLGIALLYAGTAGADRHIALCILGAAVMAVSLICGLILNLGLKNGRKNVEKIMAVLEGGGKS